MPAEIKTKFANRALKGPYDDDDDEEDEHGDQTQDEGDSANQEPAAKRQKTSKDVKRRRGREGQALQLALQCKAAQKPLKDNDLHKLWAVVAALGHFLNNGSHSNAWFGSDDGERCQQLNHVIGRTILSALDAVQQVGELHKDSKFKDLGLVMALFAEYSLGTPDYGLKTTFDSSFENDSAEEDDDEEESVDWHETIVAYARKAEIGLKNVGAKGMIMRRDLEVEAFGGDNTDWGFESAIKIYWKSHHTSAPIMGGSHFNIMKWTRAERKEYSLDDEDPLKDFPASVIKEGKLMPARI